MSTTLTGSTISFKKGTAKVSKADISKVNNRNATVNFTTYQSRLGRRLDNLQRKLTDNMIRLTATPLDMIRIKSERDSRSQDLKSRTITATDVVSVVLPPIEDIPLRSLTIEGDTLTVPSLYAPNGEQTYFEIYTPMNHHIDLDDILVRIIYDSMSDKNYVMALQVKEILGTLGMTSFTYLKYWVTLYDEALPKKVLDIIKQDIQKRERLDW